MNKSTKKVGLLLSGIGFILAASQAIADPINVTIADNDPRLWGFTGAGSLTAGGSSTLGNLGVGKEDNETENGTIGGQQWDMEAYVVNGSQLSIVAGFDLLNGVQVHNISAGDLFIKVGGGGPPGFDPLTFGSGNVTNVNYGYTYAIDLSLAARFGNASFGPTAQVYTLGSTTILDTVIYDQFGSNPWKYDNALNPGAGSPTRIISYVTGLSDNNAALQALGLGSLSGGNHNILTIDLSFMGTVASGTQVYFSYAMECGNDSLKGQYGGGFDRNVPDGASSALLVGLGLAGISLVAMKRR